MRDKKKQIRAGIVISVLLLGLLTLVGCGKAENEPSDMGKLIESQNELKRAVAAAMDGDTLYVGNIDFTNPSPDVMKSIMQVEVDKSLTIKGVSKDEPAVFTNGMFLMKGNKSAGAISLRFENILFDGNENTDELVWDDRLYPWDEIDERWIYEQPAIASHALSFSGNVDAVFEHCEFKNYVHECGAIMDVRYADYTGDEYWAAIHPDQSGCRLSLCFNDCVIRDNASFYDGGAFYIESNNNVTLQLNRTTLLHNSSGSGMGGGAIYAEGANLDMVDCRVEQNQNNRLYPGREASINEYTYDTSRGGGLYLWRCNLTMTDSILSGNTGSMGGALALTNSKADIDGCRFLKNRAEGRVTAVERLNQGPWCNMGQGGALYVEGDGNKTVSLINCCILGNSAEAAYGGIYQFYSPHMDPSLGCSYLKLTLCTYIGNACDSVYDYESIDPMMHWLSVPGDVFADPYTTAQGCLIIDDGYQATFLREELPSAENDYNYFASPEKAAKDGIQITYGEDITEPSAMLPKGDLTISDAKLSELVSGRYGGKLTKGVVGSNYKKDYYRSESPEDSNASGMTEKGLTGRILLMIAVVVVGLGLILLVLTYHIRKNRKKKRINGSDLPQNVYKEAAAEGSEATAAAETAITEESTGRTEPDRMQRQIIIAHYSEEQITRIMNELPEVSLFTERERMVFHEMLLGKKQGEIASKLVISTSTVKDFYKKIYDKMDVTSKDALLEKVFREANKL